MIRRIVAHNRLELAGLVVLGLVLFIRFPVNFILHPPFLIDFRVYQTAARLVAQGQSFSLYDVTYSPGMHFKYAPIWAVLWLPLAALTDQQGAVLWGALNVAWWLAACWLVRRIAARCGLSVPVWAPWAATVLLTRALTEEFLNGQANFWWAGLVLLAIDAATRERPALSGLWLALSILLKLPSALFMVFFALTSRVKLAVATALWTAGLLVGGALFAAPATPAALIIAWLRRLAAMGPEYVLRIGDQSLLGLFGRLCMADGYGLNLVSWPRNTVFLLALAVNLSLFAAVVARSRRSPAEPSRFAADTALLMILMVIASPSAWLATYTALLYPTALALGFAATTGPATALLAVPLALLSGLTHRAGWKPFGLREWRGETYLFLVFMIMPLFGLALFGLLWRQPLAAPRAPAS